MRNPTDIVRRRLSELRRDTAHLLESSLEHLLQPPLDGPGAVCLLAWLPGEYEGRAVAYDRDGSPLGWVDPATRRALAVACVSAEWVAGDVWHLSLWGVREGVGHD